MIRLILAVAFAIFTAVLGAFLALNPGRASFEFLGIQTEMPFVLAAGGIIVFAFLMVVVWWAIYMAWSSPDKLRNFVTRRRREQGYDALEKALIASAAGDGETAVRQAARADALLDRPALSRLLAARAAEAAGNIDGAQAHYEALLEDNRTRVMARRGLAQLAHERGDHNATAEHAQDAFNRAKGARWAFEALFDAQIAQGRWEEALDTLNEAERRKQMAPDRLLRRRAVIMTAAANKLEEDQPERARDLAEAATRAAPDFAPAATLAARLLTAGRRFKKASDVLEASWTAAPHPVTARVYRELRKSDTRSKRQERLKTLADLQPEHRESQLIRAEIALDEGESATAESLLKPLLEEGAPSARLCALAARLARLKDEDEQARRWMTRAAHASVEADWSDMDEDGRPFPYTEDDWKRMVYVFGDEARLIHPRYERYESAAEAVPETALLEAPRAKPASGGVTPGSGTQYFEAPRQPDDPGIETDGDDELNGEDAGRAA
ncbi:heme biosynthesis HemY N-terminal domain-containing protein [Maricaulis sp.]|uniref:heme biosynthesis protein HemY n=1 Tax=Maricaulis sp. TaxID=1486257 RepID=UPI002637AB0F|nr:heme biosynthesis HemY N-terminal domain-containing protein [Maricaulis sp.]